jgi:hypothetical protein
MIAGSEAFVRSASGWVHSLGCSTKIEIETKTYNSISSTILFLTMTADTRHKERIRRRAGDGLYQITWDSQGNPLTQLQTQQQQQQSQQQQQQQQVLLVQQPQTQPLGMSSGTSVVGVVHPLDPSLQQISFQELNPIPKTVWSYTVFLGCLLGCWFMYLLLPRGVRKRYFHAPRKRYARRTDRDMPPGGYWLPVQSMNSMDQHSDVNVHQHHQQHQRNPPLSSNLASPRTPPRRQPLQRPTRQTYQNTNSSDRQPRDNPPSPEHPALRKIPPNKIIAETMGRLQGRGIRLVAHGVHCDPKRVWIKLEEEHGTTTSVTWQTEFPRRVPDQTGQVSIVLMRGSLHRIGLDHVLYIDVGKKTNALQRLDYSNRVPDPTCFSLLTQNGSLDLQANSKLERDALVSCFSLLLDDVHVEDWRALYEASPDPSIVTSTSTTNNQGTEIAYYGQSDDKMVEI